MCSGQSLGIRDEDEVVVVRVKGVEVVADHVPTQVEMRWEETSQRSVGGSLVEAGGAQAKYMVLRVSWWI